MGENKIDIFLGYIKNALSIFLDIDEVINQSFTGGEDFGGIVMSSELDSDSGERDFFGAMTGQEENHMKELQMEKEALGGVYDFEVENEKYETGIEKWVAENEGLKSEFDYGFIGFGSGILDGTGDESYGGIGSEIFGEGTFLGNIIGGDEAFFSEEVDVGYSDSQNYLENKQEDLQYLRDVAQKEVVNKFNTAEIKVDFNNNATINSEMDIDVVMNKFAQALRETIDTSAEEVGLIV